MRDKIENLFEELNWIEDADLREKVIRCWMDAFLCSSFDIEDLKDVPFTLLIKDAPFSLMEHTKAVTRTARAIAKALSDFYGDKVKINMDYVVAGALLHDVGKLLEYEKTPQGVKKSNLGRRIRHPVSGTYLAYAAGIPDEVVHIIAAHSKEGDFTERSIEAIIVHHADFLNFEPFREED